MAADRPPTPFAIPRLLLASWLLWGTVIAGAAGLIWSLANWHEGITELAAALVLAAIVAELLKVKIYQARQQTLAFSLSMVVIMAAVTSEPLLGPLIGLCASLTHLFASRQKAPDKIAFNLANVSLAAGAAGVVYAWLRPSTMEFGLWHLAAAGVAVITFYVLNIGLISAMISLHSTRTFASVLRDSAWFAPTSILLGLTGAFVGGINDLLGLMGAVMFLVPVLLMRFTLSFYSQKSQATIKTLEVQADRLDHQARFDALTELPNRLELQDQLEARLADGAGQSFAVLFMDLDRFKDINDTFGHHLGDQLLKQVGPRLRRVLPETDLIARLGGDEYGVLLATADSAEACQTAQRLLTALQDAFLVEGQRLDVGASMGIAVWPQDGPDSTTLLRRADMAMYAAKRDRSGFAQYAPEHDGFSPERLALVGDLRAAIDNGELVLYFQPQIDLHSGDVRGCEALVRWIHPQRGLVPPDEFIPLAEHTGLIKPLTRWVLDAALRECRGWLDAGWDLTVSVNASVHDLDDPTFPDMVAWLLEKHAVPARCLGVEVTEGAMMSDITRTCEILGRVRALGAGVAIDDFGTGYSSLAYLKRLPVTELKVDRSFVLGLPSEAGDRAIVRATVALAHDFGLRVVAEGAEDQATLDLLAELGCDDVQGYVLSRPLPIAAFLHWLTARAASLAESPAA